MTEGKTKREEPSGHGWRERRAKKPWVRTWNPWKKRYQTSEANSSAPRKPSLQKTTTSNDSIRKRKNSNKPRIEPNRGCAKSGVGCGRKGSSIVGPMQEEEGS